MDYIHDPNQELPTEFQWNPPGRQLDASRPACSGRSPNAMKRAVVISLIFAAGVVSGLLADRLYRSRSETEMFRYFAVRPTMVDFDERGSLSEQAGAIRDFGSQEIAFLESRGDVRIYRITGGGKSLLHELTVDSSLFRSLFFTAYPMEDGRTGLAMWAQSALRSAKNIDIRPEYQSEPNLFSRHWRYDLGVIKYVHASCNQAVTTNPLWKPSMETLAISYQISKNREELRDLASTGNILFSWMSEEAMIDASKNDANVEFVLVTVRFAANPES